MLDETDGPIIADFKTTSRGGEPLEITNEIQLSSYSYLFRHTSQRPESALEIRNLVKTKTPWLGHRRRKSKRIATAPAKKAILPALQRDPGISR